MPFRDHFSGNADTYAAFRPGYPDELFDYLTSLTIRQDLAWDCGTGNGQAALALAQRFRRVIATDASQAQLSHAVQHQRIEYRTEGTESTSLDDQSVDLTTVSTAVQWCDFDRFFAEVRRVSRPGAILAVWAYRVPSVSPSVDAVLNKYADETLAPYWPERVEYLNQHYRTLPFPFEELRPPRFTIRKNWDLHHLVGMMRSWSGTTAYLDAKRVDPIQQLLPDLTAAWGSPDDVHPMTWDVFMRVGVVPSGG
jgi:ubiquinone/menaquinone biosynthesis C-methylase UbiE